MMTIRKLIALLLSVAVTAASVAVVSLSASAAQRTYLRGDANGDGVIDIGDATTIQMVLAELLDDTDGTITLRGDLTGDGLDISDATQIQMYSADYENIYHIGEEVAYPEPTTVQQDTTQKPTRDPYELPFIPIH